MTWQGSDGQIQTSSSDAPSEAHYLTVEVIAKAAVESRSIEEFLRALGPELQSSPLRVDRVFLSLQTLHPAFRARTYLWRHGVEDMSMIEWPHGLKNRPGYYDSPDFHVHRSRMPFRVSDLRRMEDHPCDLYGKLKADGYSDYLMVPLAFSDGTVNTLSIATRLPAGFASDDLDGFLNLRSVLLVALERYAALETVNSALDTYLGRSVAREILRGNIRSGHGEAMDAVILFADLDDFTGHSARLDPVETVRLLNDYFDCLVGPIEERRGYVLKFIGDAILGFFPMLYDGGKPAPLEAVLSIRRRIGRLNLARQQEGLLPLSHALCVHFGRVLYGNVGSTERLDFTIIGEAVNTAARGVETAKKLRAGYVFTGAFVEQFGDQGLVPLGKHKLRGIMGRLELFTLATEAAAQVPRGADSEVTDSRNE